MVEETKVKKTRKPRAKKASKQVVEQPQAQQVQLKIEDIITWDDAKCNEMNATVQIPLTQVRDILKNSVNVQNNYNVLRTVLMTGAMLGYSVECPQCHKVMEVNPKDLVREGNVICPDCGASYEQTKAIRGITTYERDKQDA